MARNSNNSNSSSSNLIQHLQEQLEATQQRLVAVEQRDTVKHVGPSKMVATKAQAEEWLKQEPKKYRVFIYGKALRSWIVSHMKKKRVEEEDRTIEIPPVRLTPNPYSLIGSEFVNDPKAPFKGHLYFADIDVVCDASEEFAPYYDKDAILRRVLNDQLQKNNVMTDAQFRSLCARLYERRFRYEAIDEEIEHASIGQPAQAFAGKLEPVSVEKNGASTKEETYETQD